MQEIVQIWQDFVRIFQKLTLGFDDSHCLRYKYIMKIISPMAIAATIDRTTGRATTVTTAGPGESRFKTQS